MKKGIDKKRNFSYSVLIAFASEKGRLPKEVGLPVKAALFLRRGALPPLIILCGWRSF